MFSLGHIKENTLIRGEVWDGNPDAMDLTERLSTGCILPFSDKMENDANHSNGKGSVPALVTDFGQMRNKVWTVKFRGRLYVAKRYKAPEYLAGVAKRVFSKSKAHKASRNARRLIDAGFKTARPVVWWEEIKNGAVTDSWLVTEYLNYPVMAELYSDKLAETQRKSLLRALCRYLLRLHSAGLMPCDFNGGNLFYVPSKSFKAEMQNTDPATIADFYHIDINRFRFGRQPGFRQVMKSFDQMGIGKAEYEDLLYPYADAKGWDREKCVKTILNIRKQTSRRKHLSHMFSRKHVKQKA